MLSSPGAVPLGTHTFGVAFMRTGTVEGSRTPLGDVALFVDDVEVGGEVGRQKTPPGTFGLPEQLRVGSSTGSPVPRAYKAPLRVHGWHHCAGERRRLGQAVRECGT